MKSSRLTFDFSDFEELVDILRIESAKRGTSQKALVVAALKAFFADSYENKLILSAADKSFSEWHSEEDKIYDKL